MAFSDSIYLELSIYGALSRKLLGFSRFNSI
jgi:hypothetical protein